MNHFLHRQFSGPGGIRSVLVIAFPMVVSQASDTLMMLVDRIFLSRLGSEYLAAAMSGGLTSFMFMTLFVGVIGYTNALVAQHLGARQPQRCSLAVTQALILGLACYPLILCCLPLGGLFFDWAGHDPAQRALEQQYFSILIWGGIFAVVRCALAGFFTGIGETWVVMLANLVAMVVNIAANSVLIFGLLGFPRLEMAGAAYGTLLGSAVGVLILAAFYLGPDCRRRFATGSAWCFDRSLLGKLLRYGTPSGIELLLNITAFNVFVQMFHSYGRHVAAAITVTFNWDMVAFVPMIGVNAAAMSLVGRYMGAREPDLAERATYSCLKVAWVYAALLTVLFVLLPGPLVSVFTRGLAPADAQVVTPLATWFLRLASLYVLADATSLVFGGALRGAGDTFWAMVVSTILHWCMASSCYVLIRRVELAPKVVWTVFVLLVVCLGTVFALRFLGGHWRSIRVVGEGGDPGGPLLPALEPPTAVDPC